MNSLIIPQYAKRTAKEGLKLRSSLPKSKRFGLDPKEAKKLGVFSGVTRAIQIISKKSYKLSSDKDKESLKSMYKFYKRFRNCKTFNCEGSMKLWGGRKFLKEKVLPFVNKHKI